jgi:hypothetical protein
MPGLNVYCGPILIKSPPCASYNVGKEMVWTVGTVSEYYPQSAIISFVSIIIRKEYKPRQQCHFILLVDVLRY